MGGTIVCTAHLFYMPYTFLLDGVPTYLLQLSQLTTLRYPFRYMCTRHICFFPVLRITRAWPLFEIQIESTDLSSSPDKLPVLCMCSCLSIR